MAKKSAGRPSDHQAPFHGRHRLHLRDQEEPPQRPRPHRAHEVRPGRPQARRIPRGALTMAKKSKIARNNQRAVIVERYAAKRLRTEEGPRRPGRHRREPRSRPRRPAEAASQRLAGAPAQPRRRSTAVPVASSRSSASRVSASVTWPTAASCPVSPSLLGSSGQLVTTR